MEEAGVIAAGAKGLTERAEKLLRQRWPVSHPELHKVVASFPEAAAEIARLAARRPNGKSLDDGTLDRLKALLDTDITGLDLDSAWQLLEALQLMCLAVGSEDSAYVGSLLDVERELEARTGDWEDPWPYFGWGRARWRNVFPADMLAKVKDDTAVEHLNMLFRVRAEDGRKRRARLAVRNRYLFYSLLVLAPLVGLLVPVAVSASDGALTWPVVLLAALAGAVGGTVSGAFRIRGLLGLTEFRLLGLGVLVQPLVGAAAALFVVFVLMSGVVELPGVDPLAPSWAGLATYGFAVGFSEPFWLGVVRKVAGIEGA